MSLLLQRDRRLVEGVTKGHNEGKWVKVEVLSTRYHRGSIILIAMGDSQRKLAVTNQPIATIDRFND